MTRRNDGSMRRRAACLTLMLLFGASLRAPAARAGEVIEVTTTAQGVSDGLCSLQEAIYSAEFGDNIAIDSTDPDHTYTTGCEPGTGSGDTISLPGGTLHFGALWDGDAHNPFGPTATPIIFTRMTIEGPGTTLVWDGPGHARLFAVGSASITPTSGDVTGTTFSGTGDLTLEDLVIKNFSVKGGDGADGGGGGLGAGGAIYVGRNATAEVYPSLTVVNSTFVGNGATGGNGAGGTAGGGGGMGGNGGHSVFWQGIGYVGGGGGGARGNGADGGGGGGGGTVFDGGQAFYDEGRHSNDGGPGGYLCGAAGGNDGSGDNDGHDASTSCPGGGGGGAGADFTINPYASFNGGDGSYGGGGGGGNNGGGTSFFGGGGGSASTCLGQCAGDGGFGGGGGASDGHGGRFFGGNASAYGGGGGAGLGGAIFNDSGTVVIQNSTFVGNAVLRGLGGGAGADNGGDSGAAIFSRNGSLTVQNSTISGGTASGAGGGIVVVRDGVATTFVLDNTIIADSGARACIVTGSVDTTGSAGNLVTDNDNCPNVVRTGNPHLDALALNDPGDTPTMAIHAGASPAVDAGDDGTALAQDQRRVDRPQGIHTDIGAYEATASADMQLTKGVSTSTAIPGDAITYTLDLANAGPSDAGGVTVTDALPSELAFGSCSASDGGQCTEASGTVTATYASFAANASATITIAATLKTGAADGVTVTNGASASADSPADPDPDNNSATASFTVHNRADLQVSESVVKVPNMHLVYTFSVKNLGPYQGRGITLTEPIPAGTRFVSVSPGPWSCAALPAGSTGTLTCTLASLDANATAKIALDVKVVTVGRNVTSTVTVAAVTVDPNSANNSASLTTKVGSAKW